uniref:Replication protein A 32 kDa subunit n=1 Tax=Aotus nancymaae TaxID=37293 RepID=A0A2K5DAH1_AOTNA
MSNSGFESYSREKKSNTGAQHIEPCTVTQLLFATSVDGVFQIGNVEISQVTLAGIIRHTEKASINNVYKIDDMTAAPMDVRQWIDTDDTSSENIVVPPETYVKVAGHLRSFENKKILVAFKIMPLEAHMILSEASIQPSAGTAPLSNLGKSEAGYFGGNSFIPANVLTVAQNKVLNLIKACPRPEELNFQDLKNQLKHMSVSSIKQAVDFLSNEGHIYSAMDDEHFKSTDAE